MARGADRAQSGAATIPVAGGRAFGTGASRLPLSLVLLAAIVLYVPALGTQFVTDDYLFLDQVRERSLWNALLALDPLSNFIRPVSRQLYFWMIARLTNESPLAFRIGNLVTLLVAIALLAALVRRLAGARAAIFAAAFFALHYASDVSVRWACGSQELLAVVGALAAIHLHVTGRRLAAGLAMLGAAFSKEVVLLTPLIAALADHAPGERWWRAARRAWPLGAAVLIWLVVFMTVPHRRVAQGTEVRIDLVQGPPAALAHLLQVVPGIEWLPGRFGALPRELPPLLPTLAALAAIAMVWRRRAEPRAGARVREPSGRRRHALRVAGVWILLGTAPVAAVVVLWSSYYYLFAMAGVGLALGTLLARFPAWAACGALALLSWGSANGRAAELSGVRNSPWLPISSINRSYIERSNRISARYLSSLRRAVPEFPRGSTVYFAGLQSNVGFQRANGPLLRWAYRDSSLRSYFLTAFSLETARSGPLYFFVGEGDSLAEMKGGDDLYLRIAFAMIVSDGVRGARDALHLAVQRMPGSVRAPYWHSWASLSLGDAVAARRQLGALGFPNADTRPAPAQDRDAILARVAAGDTAGAIARARVSVREHPYDAGAHGLLADLLLARSPDDADGAIEAFASRVLDPGEPYGWRRWAMVQLWHKRYVEALASFRTYFRTGGDAAAGDDEARRWEAGIRGRIPEDVTEREDPLR